jgi:hypothetical protein
MLRLIKDVEAPETLYRIVPYQRLLEMLGTSQTALVSPVLWEDPYEAAPLRIQLTHPLYRDIDGAMKVGMKFLGEPARAGTWSQGGGAIRLVYCQSWTATAETDTMWRAYSQAKDGVRLRVNTSRLLNTFKTAWPEDSCFLCEVDYIPREEIDEQLSDGVSCYRLQMRGGTVNDVHGLGWIPALSRKRSEFRPEHEYRLVLINRRGVSTVGWPKLMFQPFEVMDLVEEITLDPRSDKLLQVERELRCCIPDDHKDAY